MEAKITMKNNLFSKIIITGALCIALVVPSYAKNVDIQPILAEKVEIIPISYNIGHWSQMYIDQLSGNHNVETVFKNRDVNSEIVLEDFTNLVRLVLDEEYDGVPDALTREALVHELVEIWAQKSAKDLTSIPVVDMLIYADTEKIDVKYKHTVTVAYMKGIAKGKGEGIFDPKANVTYGELAALINNTKIAIEDELIADIKPIVKGRFETRANCTVKDGKVIFDFELMSHHATAKKIRLGSGQQFELTITDEKGEEVYRYSDGKFFTLALIVKVINPGESLKWQQEWDMTNKRGERLESGNYKAKIDIMLITEENDEVIEQSELTTTIDINLEELRQNANELEEKTNNPDYELTEEGIIKPEIAKEIIEEISNNVIHAMKMKDATAISSFAHPEKGVRFTPYTYVSLEKDEVFNLEKDIVFNKEQLQNFFKDTDSYLWGYYDGSGFEINLTPSEYYEKFVYSNDFENAPEVGYNEVLSIGNMLENQFEVYDNAIVVEYYFPGFNPDYVGMDWKSLRLVFQQLEGDWKLVGIIHNQWTI